MQGNFIGTDVTGTAKLGNDGHGIWLVNGPRNSLIGGTVAAARNIISGNENGIQVQSIFDAANNNQIFGNYIGTDVTGTAKLGNSQSGIRIERADNVTIGGTAPSGPRAVPRASSPESPSGGNDDR